MPTVFSHQYVTHVTPSLEHLSNNEKTYSFFQQVDAAADAVNNSMHCSQRVFENRIINKGLWSPHLLDLNLYSFYL
jgi:hypothetical protein